MTYLRRILAILSARRWSPSVEIDRSGRTNVDGLTRRQYEVLCLMARGLSGTEIARELGISADTVKVHVTAMYARLGVHSREEAYAAVGWLRVPEEAA